jgi:hypothetical protein
MQGNVPRRNYSLNLRAGELVQVRSESEILATLDANGRLDALPFMPEMLQFCGKQFKVYKRAHKTCDTIHLTGGRKMASTVHLEDTRCDGAAHAGCQARCLIFWKEAWLQRVHPSVFRSLAARVRKLFDSSVVPSAVASIATRATLHENTQVPSFNLQPGEEIYSCQTTDLLKATAPLPWWDFRQYFEDVSSGNTSILRVFNFLFYSAVKRGLVWGVGYRAQLAAYNGFQRITGGTPFPYRGGELTKTPRETLDLQPGELVQVKTNQEILATLDRRSKNRGLLFDLEEVPYCGGTYKVLDRVERIINEKTGKMMQLPGDCIMLEGAICRSLYSDRRAFCPRSIYSYWRETWLRRVE